MYGLRPKSFIFTILMCILLKCSRESSFICNSLLLRRVNLNSEQIRFWISSSLSLGYLS